MKKLLYIVEDNRMMREFLKGFLSDEYDLQPFETGKEALNAITATRTPALIILDFQLTNGETGLDLLRTFKFSEESSHIPVVFLSGEKKSEVRIKCLEEGASDYIIKPFNPTELKLRVKNAINFTTTQDRYEVA